MGREKALIEFRGEPLIARTAGILRPIFSQIVVVTASPAVANAANLPAITDIFPGRGPVGGLHAAALHFGQPFFAVACDMPFLNAAFIRHLCGQLDGFEAVVPRSLHGLEPLHAVYAPSCAALFEGFLRGETTPPLRRMVEKLDARFLCVEEAQSFDPTLSCFQNWNAPDDVRDT